MLFVCVWGMYDVLSLIFNMKLLFALAHYNVFVCTCNATLSTHIYSIYILYDDLNATVIICTLHSISPNPSCYKILHICTMAGSATIQGIYSSTESKCI